MENWGKLQLNYEKFVIPITRGSQKPDKLLQTLRSFIFRFSD